MGKRCDGRITRSHHDTPVGESMTEATIEIRDVMKKVLRRLEKQYPEMKFYFTGKYVECFESEGDLSTLPF